MVGFDCITHISFFKFISCSCICQAFLFASIDDDEPSCPDVAIVGAGLAGSYAAWRLRHKNITMYLYEMSDRIGGRIFTRQFPNASDTNIEVGASYYIPKLHKTMDKIIKALALQRKQVYQDCNEDCIMYKLRGVSLTNKDLANSTKIPYNLDVSEQDKLPSDLLRYVDLFMAN